VTAIIVFVVSTATAVYVLSLIGALWLHNENKPDPRFKSGTERGGFGWVCGSVVGFLLILLATQGTEFAIGPAVDKFNSIVSVATKN
jgi:hypothetical protein